MDVKVAINKCWGGFGISHKAAMLYAKKSGFELYPYIDKRGKNGELKMGEFVPYIGQEKAFLIYYSTKPLRDNGTPEENSHWSDSDIERNDPILISVIEELGVEANGDYANIKIVEIPDGIQWEIDEYARKYVKEYEKNQNWNDPDKRATMEMKTVLRRLLDWTDKSGKEGEKLAEALKADTEPETEVVDVPSEDVPQEKPTSTQPMNIDEARKVTAALNGKEVILGNLDIPALNQVYLTSILNDVVEAARIVLKEDFRMDPPQEEKRTHEQLQSELGF